MTLDPDEKELLESFERGEWKPIAAAEVGRMKELARQRLIRETLFLDRRLPR